ncbi:hypothetical protein EJD97_016464 [Solanum chilense]|uniref:Uncharacterized protein n=1 Tax=Solanum chilense TaxID=4083 RepID=A0A6N2CF76_SOLCI|nr:hypothetical protein EJD97_016464 [Solanum chilense]
MKIQKNAALAKRAKETRPKLRDYGRLLCSYSKAGRTPANFVLPAAKSSAQCEIAPRSSAKDT